jgi:hypothetical protein
VDNARVQKAMVRTDSKHSNTVLAIVNAPDFQQRIDTAFAEPEGQVSRNLLKEVLPTIMIAGGKIPYSPLERGTRAPVELFGLVRFMSFPNVLLTMGPDETRTAIVARISICNHPNQDIRNAAFANCRTTEDFWNLLAGNGNPTDFGEYANILPEFIKPLDTSIEIWRKDIGQAIMNDPAAVATTFQRILDMVNECLIGIPCDRSRNKKKQFSYQFSRQERGIFGRAFAYFYVTEVSGKYFIHF